MRSAADSHNRLYPISMGRYGPMVDLPRILDTSRRLGLKRSFFIPGWCPETYPDVAKAILKDEREIGHHGYLHEDPIKTRGAQREWFERRLDVHIQICGQKPRGFCAPVSNITQDVLDLMIKNGMRCDSSMMADDIPYRLDTCRSMDFQNTTNQDVWLATLNEIADHIDLLQKDGIWRPSVDRFPYYDNPILGETP